MPVQQQDPDGQWRQAIPLPFYGRHWHGRTYCQCGACRVRFATEQEYRDHYRSDHPEAS